MDELDAALRKSIGAPPRGFASGLKTGGGAVPAGTGPSPTSTRTPTTLGSSSGEVTPGASVGSAERRRRKWRRRGCVAGGRPCGG